MIGQGKSFGIHEGYAFEGRAGPIITSAADALDAIGVAASWEAALELGTNGPLLPLKDSVALDSPDGLSSVFCPLVVCRALRPDEEVPERDPPAFRLCAIEGV